jgi:hypothetical protein
MNMKSTIAGLVTFSVLAGAANAQGTIPGGISNRNENNSIESLANDPSYIMVHAENIGGREYKLPVSVREYMEFKNMNHSDSTYEDMLNWVTYTNQTIERHTKLMTKDKKSKEEKAQIILDFVHTRFYDKSIEEGPNYVKYPIETMVEGVGDCEDMAILAASMMKSIGIDVALVVYTPENGNHVALGISGDFKGIYFEEKGKKYYYAETTGTEWLSNRAKWRIGEMPEEYTYREALIFPVK